MIKKLLIPLLIVAFVFSGCKNPNNVIQPGMGLFGTWLWFDINLFTGDTIDWYLTFNSNLTFSEELYENEVLQYSSNGTFTYTDTAFTLSFEDGDIFTFEYELDGYTLTVIEMGYNMGYIYVFYREEIINSP